MSVGKQRGTVRRIGSGDGELTYRLRRGETKHLSISVNPDLSVVVVAPRHADASEVDKRVQRRVGWIRRQQHDFLQYHPLPAPRRFVSGETHAYLGRQYRLRVRKGPPSVVLAGGRLVVTVPRGSSKQVERALREWYRGRAKDVFVRRLESVLRAAPWLGPAPETLHIRVMTRRWGSCSPRGTVSLNLDLVKVAPSCIDYVIAHELTHRIEMSHSPRFHRLLERAVPEWRRARERLNRSVA